VNVEDKKKEEGNMSSNDTPLSTVPGWSKAQVEALAAYWITSAEQVVGIGATSQGVETLAKHLGITEPQMRELIGKARATLPAAVAAEMERVDTSQYGLGALPPEEKK
jgi:hypothetical protein